MKKTLLRIFVVVLGTAIAALGMDLAIHAGFGAATLAVLWQGLSHTLPVTLGQASLLVAVAMVAFCWFYDRKQINIGTVLYQVVYSYCIDFFAPRLVYSGSTEINGLLMLLGIGIFAFGSALYSAADFGKGPYEALTFALAEKRGWSIRRVRTALDVACVVSGLALGGKAGACTVATVLMSGVILQRCVALFRKIRESCSA